VLRWLRLCCCHLSPVSLLLRRSATKKQNRHKSHIREARNENIQIRIHIHNTAGQTILDCTSLLSLLLYRESLVTQAIKQKFLRNRQTGREEQVSAHNLLFSSLYNLCLKFSCIVTFWEHIFEVPYPTETWECQHYIWRKGHLFHVIFLAGKFSGNIFSIFQSFLYLLCDRPLVRRRRLACCWAAHPCPAPPRPPGRYFPTSASRCTGSRYIRKLGPSFRE
jgi:hypothetical protein